jgi:DNA-binding transcriptional MerR regulator
MNHYPIRTISELTGVPTTTLRAWERRYGLLKPERTAKGHRLYGTEDIELVKQIVKLLKNNHTISEAIRIIRNPELSAMETSPADGHWAGYQERMMKSIESFNEQNLDKAYNDALSIYPIDMVTEHVIIPVLARLGEQWHDREAGIAEEHFFSAFLRNKLGARLHHEAQRSRGNRILVTCLPGEYHELGILLFCIAAIGHGYQILYLGTDMPPAQLPYVVQRTDVAAVLISGTKDDQWDVQLEAELKKVIKTISVPVMFGGDISAASELEIIKLGGHVLGSDHVQALEKMEVIIPAFAKR